MVKFIHLENIIGGNNLECNLNIKDKDKYLDYISKQQNPNSLYIHSFDDDTHYLVYNDSGDIGIDSMDSISYQLLTDYWKKRSRNEIENSIMSKLDKMVGESKDKLGIIKEELKNLPTRDEYVKRNRIGLDQNGGVILKYLEDEIPLFTPFLEIIDLILLPLSAIPGVGTPFDIASLILAGLRGDIMYSIASLVSFIPGPGDAVGTAGKVFLKVIKFYKMYRNENTRYIALGLCLLLLMMSSASSLMLPKIVEQINLAFSEGISIPFIS